MRHREKLCAQQIGPGDSNNTGADDQHFKILPALHNRDTDTARIKNSVEMPKGFAHASDSKPEWMGIEQLRTWIAANQAKIGAF